MSCCFKQIVHAVKRQWQGASSRAIMVATGTSQAGYPVQELDAHATVLKAMVSSYNNSNTVAITIVIISSNSSSNNNNNKSSNIHNP